MQHPLEIQKAFTLIEPGPVVLVSTRHESKNNIMAISWNMVLDFTPLFAISTGPWNHSYTALQETRECVIAIPTVDMLDQVVGIGTSTGTEVDKFAHYGLTPLPASLVGAPMIDECLANIECEVVDIIEPYNIVVLAALAAHIDPERQERRTLHAVGDGGFIVDGERLDRRLAMLDKLPPGV